MMIINVQTFNVQMWMNLGDLYFDGRLNERSESFSRPFRFQIDPGCARLASVSTDRTDQSFFVRLGKISAFEITTEPFEGRNSSLCEQHSSVLLRSLYRLFSICHTQHSTSTYEDTTVPSFAAIITLDFSILKRGVLSGNRPVFLQGAAPGRLLEILVQRYSARNPTD